MKTKICYCANCGKNTVWNRFMENQSNQFYKNPFTERWQCTNCGDVVEIKNK